MGIPHRESLPRRILLLSPNRETEPYPVFPLGLAQIGEAVQDAGFAVAYWDALKDEESALLKQLRSWQPEAIGISIRNVDNVSILDPVNYIRHLFPLMQLLRAETSVPIVLGGAGYSLFPEAILEFLEADYGISGDGGTTFIQLLKALLEDGEPQSVAGVYFRGDGVQKVPGERGSLTDRPTRPPVSWIRHYLEHGGILNVQTQRGCALKCTYCTYPSLEGHVYRFREMAVIIEEIRHLYEAGVRYVFLVDSVLNTRREHLRRLAQALIAAGFSGLQWGCFLRPVNLDGATLDILVESGLTHIEFGSDSFSDTVLPRYRKSFRFEHIQKASALAAERKVRFCHFLIFGGPGESFATIEESIERAEDLPDCPVFAFIGMRVYPGTPLHASLQGHPRMPAELLEPWFFLEEGLERESLVSFLKTALADRPNWIFGDQPEGFHTMTERLRKRGHQGPLWEYYPVMRRLNS